MTHKPMQIDVDWGHVNSDWIKWVHRFRAAEKKGGDAIRKVGESFKAALERDALERKEFYARRKKEA